MLVLDAKTWAVLILGYCFVASLVPVWALLQPRGYLGGFVLYLALAVGVVGIFLGGFPIEQQAFRGFQLPGPTGALFPFLFVTIACGACSGFHGLVCSGTTSKQIAREPHCKPIGYGAMLLEAFVALIALATIMIVAPADVAGKAPGAVYGQGLGRFLTVIIGDQHLAFAITFGAMAFSTFVFDTLDVTTRLGRYILQELLGWQGPRRRGRRHGGDLSGAPGAAPDVGCGQLPAVLDPVRHLQPAAGRAVPARDHRVAAAVGPPLPLHAGARPVRAGGDPDRAGAAGAGRALGGRGLGRSLERLRGRRAHRAGARAPGSHCPRAAVPAWKRPPAGPILKDGRLHRRAGGPVIRAR